MRLLMSGLTGSGCRLFGGFTHFFIVSGMKQLYNNDVSRRP